MKRTIITLLLLGVTVLISFAQSNYISVKDLVEGKNYSTELTIRAQFLKIDDYDNLTFIVEDQDYIIPIKLVKLDMGAEGRFRNLSLHTGDTLFINGTVNDIKVKQQNKSFKGLDDAAILLVRQDQNYDKFSSGLEDLEPISDQEDIPFHLVEIKPSFMGCDANQFSIWVNEHLVYPKAARKSGKQGRVITRFTIDKDGTITKVKVLRGVSPELDAEAVRVISSSPKWSPGMINGKVVRVTYTFPIIFSLR